MAKQLPPPTDLTGLSEEDRISLGERMYQLIMGQGGAGQQQPMRQQQSAPMRQQPAQRRSPRRSIQNAARTLMSGPPGQQPSMRGRMPQSPMQSPIAARGLQGVQGGMGGRQQMGGIGGRQQMQASPPRQMPRMQPSRRLPPPQAMNRFAPQVSPMMQTSPMMQGLYNPLGAGFMPQQAPLMAFNPYQGMM